MPPGNGNRSALAELRQRNEWAVFEAIRRSRTATRADLVRATGLSRSTIADVVVDLHERGIVDEQARAPQARRGRFGGAVHLRPAAAVAVGIAIDRERIAAAAIDLAASVLAERAETIDAHATGTEIVGRCAFLVRGLASEAAIPIDRIIGVGIGLPGPVDVAYGGVPPSSTLHRWAGVDVQARLSDALGGCTVYPDNDANYGALGEHEYGSGQGIADLLYVSVGPGVGGGLIIDGQLRRGDRGFAGELGHTTAVDGGLPCPCGRRGCLATVASSGAVAGRLASSHGPDLDVDDLLALAAAGDDIVIAALREAGTHLGRALGGLVNALNPGVVVFGGQLGAGSRHLLTAAGRALNANIQPIAGHDLRLEHAALGHRAEVLGAGARVLRDTDRLRSYLAAA